jgi:hypothetical protein
MIPHNHGNTGVEINRHVHSNVLCATDKQDSHHPLLGKERSWSSRWNCHRQYAQGSYQVLDLAQTPSPEINALQDNNSLTWLDLANNRLCGPVHKSLRHDPRFILALSESLEVWNLEVVTTLLDLHVASFPALCRGTRH